MDTILGALGGVPQLGSRNDDDLADRLSHRFTTSLLMVFAVIVSSKQYVGEPIKCWLEAEFTGEWQKYTESYCWVKNTYYLGNKGFENKNEHIIRYYQWVPLILVGQALLFYLPVVFWRSLNKRSGVDVDNIVESAETFQLCNKTDERKNNLNSITLQMQRFLNYKEEKYTGCNYSIVHIFSRIIHYSVGSRQGNYLVVLYIVIKFTFLLNAILQFLAIGYFVGDSYYSYGVDFFAKTWSGGNVKTSPIFPRVTFCDFSIRKKGDNTHTYSAQCVLSINLFNEIVFLLLWWWLIFVIIVTLYSFVKWFIGITHENERLRLIRKHLDLMKKTTGRSDDHLKKFTHSYIKPDGWFIISLVAKNTNTITAAECVCSLWEKYEEDVQETNQLSTH